MKKLLFSGLLLAGLFSFQSTTNPTVKASGTKESKVLYRKLVLCTYENDEGVLTFGHQCSLTTGQDCPFPSSDCL